jgi:Leucine-rich repeat (LRR) protein
VFCQDVPFLRLPPAINSYKVYQLHLENNGLRSVDPHFLQGTGAWHGNTPRTLTAVPYCIHGNASSRDTLSAGLSSLEISLNPLPAVPDEAFFGLEGSLKKLILQYDDLTDVPNRALRQLQKLRLLDLTGEHLSPLRSDNCSRSSQVHAYSSYVRTRFQI